MPVNQRILVADDEEDVRKLVARSLAGAGLDVLEAVDGAEALELVRRDFPVLVVLDLMLPRLSGLEVCRLLRGAERTKNIPVVMLTAKATELDRIVGFETGADDYLTKPFSPRELILRIKSLLRRGHQEAEPDDILTVGDVSVNRTRQTVHVGKKPVELTSTEYNLLVALMEQGGRVQSRDKLLHNAWGHLGVSDSRTVDVHILRLRKKLGKAGTGIKTVRGFGYQMIDLRG